MCLLSYLRRVYDARLSQNALIEHEKRCAVPTVREIRTSVDEREIAEDREITTPSTGIERNTVTGTGGVAYCDINHHGKTTWTSYLICLEVAGFSVPVDVDCFVEARNGATFLATVDVFEHDAAPAAHFSHLKAINVPCTRLRLNIPVSTAGVEYVLVGTYEEN